MCFSPQRRAIFRHRNFKKCSEPDVFCRFWLQNVLLARAACNFSTSELQKVPRACCVLYILTSKCACGHSSVQFLISPLTTWLRTRRFNEPTFRLTRHTNHWKNTAFRYFSNIWRGWMTFALLHLLSSDSTSSSDFTFFWLYFISLLFICFSTLPMVGSLLCKLPSIIRIFGLTLYPWYFFIQGKRSVNETSVWACPSLYDGWCRSFKTFFAREERQELNRLEREEDESAGASRAGWLNLWNYFINGVSVKCLQWEKRGQVLQNLHVRNVGRLVRVNLISYSIFLYGAFMCDRSKLELL